MPDKKFLTLKVAALPLGNPLDVSQRVVDALKGADIIFCEDTRKIHDLAKRMGLSGAIPRCLALPGDGDRQTDFEKILKKSEAPKNQKLNWVLVSDAGTPVVNDPGKGLIEWARSQKIPVVALPGPCAPVLAWQWSGGFGLPFVFAGFYTPRLRDRFFANLGTASTFCFFLSKHDIESLTNVLGKSGDSLGRRKCFVAREMTKDHEELVEGDFAQVIASIYERFKNNQPLGELTVLVQGDVELGDSDKVKGREFNPDFLRDEIKLLREGTPRQAAKVFSKITGWSVAECYDILTQNK